MLEKLNPLPPDPLLGLIAQYAADTNPRKVDLGVGVYRDDTGRSPVMRAVKEAERILLKTEDSKSYLGSQGVKGFNSKITELLLGKPIVEKMGSRIVTIHTPGGTAALRVGADLVKRAVPEATVWLGAPSWVNHGPVLAAAGLKLKTYEYLDSSGVGVDFENFCATIEKLTPRDVVLLQASCHNPTGASFNRKQWDTVAQLAQKRGFLPFIDVAYQGLGDGLDEDVYAIRCLASEVPEMIIASSCSKNFGLYRERTGALTMIGHNETAATTLGSTIADAARTMYSMPPSHGAAVVDVILGSRELTDVWLEELQEMRMRLRGLREAAAQAIHSLDEQLDFGFLEKQNGLFSYIGLTTEQMRKLRKQFAIYGADSSRINIAGLSNSNVDYFAESLVALLSAES